MRPRTQHTLLVGALLLAAGCARSRTEMVVVIDSGGVRVPDDVDALHIQVIDAAPAGDDTLFDQTRPLCQPQGTQDCIAFPVTMTLFPGSKRPSDAVRVRVEALRGATPVIADAAKFNFADGRSFKLDVTLWSACLGNLDCAAQDQACGSDGQCAALTPAPFMGELDLSSQPADLGVPDDLAGVDQTVADLAAADLAPGPDMAHRDLSLPPPPATFVQKSVYCQGTGSCTAMLSAPSTAGHLLVATCALASDLPPVLPAGWDQAVLNLPSTGANVSIWFYLDTAGGTTDVLVSGGGGGTVWADVSEWSGPTGLDVTGIKTAVASSSTTATTNMPANGSFGISVFGQATAPNPVMFTPSSTWTNLVNNSGVNNGWHVTTDYLIAPPLDQPLTADAMTNFSGAWVGAVATFR